MDGTIGFRPLSGLSLFLLHHFRNRQAFTCSFPSPLGVISFFTFSAFPSETKYVKNVSVPSRGYLFFYQYISKSYTGIRTFRFRPLSGLSLFLQSLFKVQRGIKMVSVPSRGYLFFTVAEMNREERTFLFPSPLGVISFFTILWAYLTGDCKRFPSPLGVISFFTKHNQKAYGNTGRVSVPSRGYLFFYYLSTGLILILSFVSVPSRGYLFFYLDSCRIRKRWIWFPSPLGVISFFTKKGKPQRTEKTARFRPLSGLSLFLRKSCRL